MKIDDRLLEAAASGNLVAFCGAGVSAGAPTSLPSWFELNAMIAEALLARADQAFEHYLSADAVRPAFESIGARRQLQRFPPDYQAQVIEELAGENYFRALTSVDVDTINETHAGIAALAEAGFLSAVVTTNFDRLIELALSERGVSHRVAIDERSFAEAARTLTSDDDLLVLKVHGSVSEPSSLVDTLKQRRLGRSASLDRCMDALGEAYFVYLGFSAADLDGDRDYLRLIPNASRSAGATYLVWPGAVTGEELNLTPGAQFLMEAYGDAGTIEIAESADFLRKIMTSTGRDLPGHLAERGGSETIESVRARLDEWALGASPAEVGLCLAALLEAAGEGDTAARVLDRLVRKVLGPNEKRDDPFYRWAQLHYGRLGMAWGRYVNVPDLHGVQSNASLESMQSLLRLAGTELELNALGWTALGFTWLGEGDSALRTLVKLQELDDDSTSEEMDPEAWVDAWIAAAQVQLIDGGEESVSWIVGSADWAHGLALECGDVVRAARVSSLELLALAEAGEDVPARVATLDGSSEGEFAEAMRVGDGVSLAFRSLALGRWALGPGGRDAADAGDRDVVSLAQLALEHLGEASDWISEQVMHPWEIYVTLQRARAMFDLGKLDVVYDELVSAREGLVRFPIWASHFHEAQFQLNLALGNQDVAAEEIANAIAAADSLGLPDRRDWLMSLESIAFS